MHDGDEIGFTVELRWCIQKLKDMLESDNLPRKRIQELRKRLKILSNDYAPIAEKRLVMRTTFGNFRQRMIKEDLQNRLMAQDIKFLGEMKDNKHIYIKKSSQLTVNARNNANCPANNTSGEFKFNFDVDTLTDSVKKLGI